MAILNKKKKSPNTFCLLVKFIDKEGLGCRANNSLIELIKSD